MAVVVVGFVMSASERSLVQEGSCLAVIQLQEEQSKPSPPAMIEMSVLKDETPTSSS